MSKNLQHFFADLGVDFLAVSALASRFVLVVRILDVDELGVWDVLDVNPADVD